jgi:hypothetical protein
MDYSNGLFPDIRCMNMPRNELFSATVKLPTGFTDAPVFEDRPEVDPINHPDCKLRPLQTSPALFRMHITDIDRCGVVSCKQPNGQVSVKIIRLNFVTTSSKKMRKELGRPWWDHRRKDRKKLAS